MSRIHVISTPINGVYVIEPVVFRDIRGYFMETYNERDFQQYGLSAHFVQDNQSMSSKGVLRGLHRQEQYPQTKLVRVLSGEVFDVCVDGRPESPTYGQWFGVLLSGENQRQFYVPKGLYHGYLTRSQTAVFAYKCDDFYHPEDEGGILWDDPDVGVEWPVDDGEEVLLSEKDKALPRLRDKADRE